MIAGTNALAYLPAGNSLVTFIPGANVIELITTVIY
jgi:hypothetical protein